MSASHDALAKGFPERSTFKIATVHCVTYCSFCLEILSDKTME